MPGQLDTATDDTDTTRPLTVSEPLATADFLPLAIDVAGALGAWHRHRGPHAAICPDAIRVTRSGRIRIESRPHGPTSAMYTAPEQTGRLERGVDERTDLYALGVLYYQLLGGRPPFEASTPAQWRRCHLSVAPTPLTGALGPLPPALGEIIAMLLSKSPDDRYQTARGVAADLERCRAALAAGDATTPMLLRTRDVPDQLVFGHRLYGRDRQLGRLQAAYDRVAAGGAAELMAITADPGLGRWTTVANFTDSVVTGGGRTVRAVSAHDDARPYAALTQLLTDLADQLADEPAEQRTRIANAVGPSGATLTELVPALRTVFGERPAPDGSIAAAHHRVQVATRRLFCAVTVSGRPLVIAVRDVQWADEPTIDLLRYVMAAPHAPALLTVVTYRPADVGPHHPLQTLLRDERVCTSSVPLRPLPDTALAELLAETLGSGARESARLSRTVAARTGSNPLVVQHFLRRLAGRTVLEYAADGARWQWYQYRVDQEPPAIGVTGLVRAQVAAFPEATRGVLEIAAVLGPRFGATALRTHADTDLAVLLRPAVRAGLVRVGAAPGAYRWEHEEVRQTVLAGIDDRRLAELRLAVGRALAPHAELLFEAATHLNAAVGLLTLADERRWLAELNADAGRRAARVGATADARRYFAAGLGLLGPEAWRRWPELALRLHIAAAEAERAAGRLQSAERLLDTAIRHVDSVTDRARLLGVRAALRRDAGDDTSALRIGIEALQLLGLPVPADPARWREASAEAAQRLREQVDDDVLDKIVGAPDCTDPRVVTASNLIADLAQPIWPDRSGGDLLATVGVELAVAHGPTAATAFLLGRVAAVFADHRQDRDASRFVSAARRLLDRPGARHSAVTRAAAAVLGPCWLDGPGPMLRELYAAYRTAVSDGEVRLAQRIGAVYSVHLFAAGTPLDKVAADIEARWRFAQRHGRDEPACAVIRLLEDAVSRLRRVPYDSPTPTADEAATRQRILRGEYGYYSIVGLSALLAPAHVLDDNGDAAQLNQVIGRMVARAPSTFLTAETVFWHAFSLVQRYENAAPGERQALRADLETFQDKLDGLAAHGPGLLRARALLLAAERARLAGSAEQARIRYDRAIAAARESDFLRSEAFAAERGGRHALARGQIGDAVAYLRRARACYQRWGAVAKFEELHELLAAASRPAGTTRALDQLDLLTLMRAFHAVSGELRLDRLVGVLLELIVSHSQAERACLLLADGDRLRPVAEAEVERDGIRVDTHVDPGLCDRVPINVIEYCGRNRHVLTGGPDELAALVSDPYLAVYRPRSVLCAPVVRRDHLLAVVYLEHRRLATAFSSTYLELLDILCTQAAIALENAAAHAALVAANRVSGEQ